MLTNVIYWKCHVDSSEYTFNIRRTFNLEIVNWGDVRYVTVIEIVSGVFICGSIIDDEKYYNIIFYFGIMNGSDELDAIEEGTIVLQKCKVYESGRETIFALDKLNVKLMMDIQLIMKIC